MVETKNDPLLSLEAEFTRALVANDAAALREVVHDDWVIVESGGRLIEGAEFLKLVESGELTHRSMENAEIRIRRYGEAAVVTGRAETEGAYRGRDFTLRERFTDVFVLERSRWRCVLTQLTPWNAEQGEPTAPEPAGSDAEGDAERPTRESPVTLREIDERSVRAICRLAVRPDQERFVAPNAVSLAQALFSKRAWYRAVYAGETPVGFVMLSIDTEKPEYFLWRFLVDARHQGLGFGAEALRQVIEHVRTLPKAEVFLTSVVPGPGSPQGFYERMGFERTGVREEDEDVLRLRL